MTGNLQMQVCYGPAFVMALLGHHRFLQGEILAINACCCHDLRSEVWMVFCGWRVIITEL